ncbi:uncharacterized protein VDAG_05683 [Verticillium dahliae VdLs.17]|uniref:Oxidoreductase acuF-like C2H2 type zinc-finger domain-containing protein n=3 Tax=Verticillium TaxID=1036719 RepID=G2X6A1_VERDV|nr:uncharacterized protein VDAG_05683 [Verticillium dahliae VdLs.17]EGY14519.1 hypothetical protein VDAG_05683 [Verticillium dahliae VdLs.17]KAH6708435.1 hypothetical protein EV126DRAFT_519121 [Verticillium dahliae]
MGRPSFLSRHDVETWASTPKAPEHGSGFIAQLFIAIRSSMASLVKSLSKTKHDAERKCRNEYERFFLWGDGLSAHDGFLDEVLAPSQELRTHLVTLLWRLGTTVSQALSHELSDTVEPSAASQLPELLEKAETMMQYTMSEETPNPNPNSSSDSLAISLTELVEDIAVYINCLMDLSHTLETPALETVLKHDEIAQTSVEIEEQFVVSSEEAMVYCRKIRDRFGLLPKLLVERLAEANTIRAGMLREMKATSMKPQTQIQDDVTETLFSSRPETTIPTNSTAPYSSIFSTNRKPVPISGLRYPDRGAQYDASLATLASGRSMSSAAVFDRPQIPPMPENYGHGFVCPICFKLVAEVNTKREWKSHVFTDLTPYICTDMSCRDTTLYNQTDRWASHEATHRPPLQKIDSCAFCEATFQQESRIFYDHVSKHLQEVSLAILPRAVDDLGEEGASDSDEDQQQPEPASVGAAFMQEASWDPVLDDSFYFPIDAEFLSTQECISAWNTIRVLCEAVVLGRHISHQYMVYTHSRGSSLRHDLGNVTTYVGVVLESTRARTNALDSSFYRQPLALQVSGPLDACTRYLSKLSETASIDLLQILVQGFDGVERQIHQDLAPYVRARTDYESIRLENIGHELRAFVGKHFQGVLTASVLMPLDQTSMSMYTCTWPTITNSQLLGVTGEAPIGTLKASSDDHRQQSIDQKLISATKEDLHDLARYFLQDETPRANPNATDIHGMTALHHAAQSEGDTLGFIKLLLAHGSEVDARCQVEYPDFCRGGDEKPVPCAVSGHTPLFLALRHGRTAAMEELLLHGASMQAALFEAVTAKDASMVRMLFRLREVNKWTLGASFTLTEEYRYKGKRIPLNPLELSAALGDQVTAGVIREALLASHGHDRGNDLVASAFGTALNLADIDMASILSGFFDAWKPWATRSDKQGNSPLALLLKMILASGEETVQSNQATLQTIAGNLVRSVAADERDWLVFKNSSGESVVSIFGDNFAELEFLKPQLHETSLDHHLQARRRRAQSNPRLRVLGAMQKRHARFTIGGDESEDAGQNDE